MDAWHWLLLGAAGAAVAILGGRRVLKCLPGRRERSGGSRAATQSFVASRLPVGVLLFATDGRIRYANERARGLLFSGEAPEGRNFLHLLGEAPAPVSRALTTSSDALFTLEADGEQQTFQVLRREVDREGEPHVLLLINPLTREVGRREADVLKKVIRVINHELNNSLATLSSLVSSGRFIVEHPEKLAGLHKVFDGIESRTKHLQKFLEEYAQLSRLPAPRARSVPWRPLLQRLQTSYPHVALGPPPREPGWFDETQIEQAVINLIKNACESGGAEEQVSVVFRHVDDGLELGVLDRGRGFSREALQQGLLPFYSTKEGGSGVGLALCREVAEGHGGRLRIKAREGGGSAVYLELPFRSVESPSSKSVALTLTRT